MSDQRVPPEELPIGNVDASGQAIDQSVDGLPEDDVDLSDQAADQGDVEGLHDESGVDQTSVDDLSVQGGE
jgi:hypothetical protein